MRKDTVTLLLGLGVVVFGGTLAANGFEVAGSAAILGGVLCMLASIGLSAREADRRRKPDLRRFDPSERTPDSDPPIMG